jgi:DNA repair photolyase
MTLVRLSGEVLPVFTERIEEAYPLRAKKILGAIHEMRGGKMNHTAFHERMHGKGERWMLIEQIFKAHTSRLGYNIEEIGERHASTFERPTYQLPLFR